MSIFVHLPIENVLNVEVSRWKAKGKNFVPALIE